MSESETHTSPEARGITAVFDELLKQPVTTIRGVRATGRSSVTTWNETTVNSRSQGTMTPRPPASASTVRR